MAHTRTNEPGYMVGAWKMWFEDGSTFTSRRGSFAGAPSDLGLEFIVLIYIDDGTRPGLRRHLIHGRDFYWEWGSGDDLAEAKRHGIVLKGKTVGDDFYARIEFDAWAWKGER